MINDSTSQDGSPSGDTPTDQSREIVDDVVNFGAPGAGWNREEYTDPDGKKRIRLTKR